MAPGRNLPVLTRLLARAAREVVAQLDQPCLVLSREWEVVFANAGLLETLGQPARGIDGLSLFELAGGGFDTPSVRDLFAQVVRDGPVHRWRLDRPFPKVGRKVLDLDVVPIRGSFFDTGLTVVAIHDETHRILLEEERIHLVEAIEQAPAAIVMTDPDGVITYVNPSFEVITGTQRREVTGARLLEVIQTDERLAGRIAARLRRAGRWSGVLTGHRTGPGGYEVDATVSAVFEPTGSLTGYVAVGRDLATERSLGQTIERQRSERAEIALTLSRLHPTASAEAGALAVCNELRRLAGVDFVAVLTCMPNGTVVPVAVSPPLGVPMRQNVALPGVLGRQIQDRLREGPWLERFTLNRTNGLQPHRAGWLRSGVEAMAYVPLRGHGGEAVGALALGSRCPDGAEGMAALLATAIEVGAFASVMVGPNLRELQERSRIQRSVWESIRGHTFRTVFQPIVELAGRSTVGYEALTRFADGTPPDQRFAEAESVGLGALLERACLESAVEAAVALPAGWISLNVSPAFLVGHFRRHVALQDLTKRDVVLEILESHHVDDYHQLSDVLAELGARGIRVATDDTGRQFAGIDRLLQIRPQFIKIDSSIVRGVEEDAARQALFVGIQHFAQQTGAQLIAEGIETESEHRTVVSLGVELGQGYLYGYPAPAETLWGAPAQGPLEQVASAARDGLAEP